MCGICGKLVLCSGTDRVDPDVLRAMTMQLSHRGPDATGTYLTPEIGLGHTRLSIIDLATGTQPMSNEDGTVWVAFNGEIYNHKDLRAFLIGKGHRFASTSDTEVIVHLYEEFGPESIRRLSGMFAIALWDAKEKTLLLARDRVGIKPLYYFNNGRSLLFGSEIKAILADPSVQAPVDLASMDRFLTYSYTPGETTLFKNIRKIPAGHYAVIKNGRLSLRQYWDLSFSNRSQNKRSLEDCSRELDGVLQKTIREHMIADVPVGVLLSGGVDSTAVLSYATEHTGHPISTFTVGFDGQHFADERPYARLAAERYGSDHHEMTLTAAEFRDFLPRFVWHMEEPVCEPPAIALFYVTQMARKHVTVLLSGEGGDEAFAGYPDYRTLFWMEQVKRSLGAARKPVGQLAAWLTGFPGLSRVRRYLPLMQLPFEDYYFSRTADPFQFLNPFKKDLYTRDFKAQLAFSWRRDEEPLDRMLSTTRNLDSLSRMLYIDTKTWLPDDLLIKADRMTMANSLELRVPFLDHHVLEFAASLPRDYKIRGWQTKYLLKHTLAPRVPAKILKRKKAGFPVPYGTWMRGELWDDIASTLTDPGTVARGLFRPETIQKILLENRRSGAYSKEVFSLFILELWQRTFSNTSALSPCPTLC